jgi:excisionase family DNA binding protein
MTAKYGMEIPTFVVENISVPQEVEEAIDKRSSMAAVGNLNDYVKFQLGKGMEGGAGGGGGAAGTATELAVGLAIAQQIMAQQGGGLFGGGAVGATGGASPGSRGPTATGAAGGIGAGAAGAGVGGGAVGATGAGVGSTGGSDGDIPALPDLLSPAQVAQALGVSEADVQAIIESGELQAKKIGSAFRVKRSALDEFLAS